MVKPYQYEPVDGNNGVGVAANDDPADDDPDKDPEDDPQLGNTNW